ncbi:GNAT family N-acetyltransferase [Streptomyces sp. NPDC002588]|uniref:GNAT family N-acetyltransferase n=1 Tax=Streptomyces sp. NPDC002588 TaxID=3154419 RepID=UPI003332BADE
MTDGMVIDQWRTPEEARAAGWAALVGGEDFFLTPDWMRVLQDSAGAWMGYLTATEDARLVAALAMVLADRGSPWALGRTDLLIRHCAREGMTGAGDVLAGFGDPDRLMPSMMCGGRHLGRTRLLLHPDATAQSAHRLVEQAERTAALHGCRSVCFPYVDASDRLQREVLRERGYTSHVSGEFATLTLPGEGFMDYAMALPSRRSRRVRAERRRIEASDAVIGLEPLDPAEVPRLAALETQLFAKYGMTGWDPRRSEAVLYAAAERLGDRALVSKAVLDGRIVGFGLVLAHGGDWFAHRAGFDYAAQGALPLYYELLYYTLADHAGRHGVKTVHYGIGSTDAKVSRGCALSTQYLYVKELG